MTDKRVSELDARATPADADLIEIVADPGGSPTTLQNFKLTWANLKATLKTYFDTIYAAAANYLVSGGALGTPSSGVATNLTGTAAGLTAGNVTTNAPLTGPITSTGNATAITSPLVVAAINGGSGVNDDLTIRSTSNTPSATSYVILQPNGGSTGVGTTLPEATLHVVALAVSGQEQVLKLGVSDTDDYVTLASNTSTAGRFAPSFRGYTTNSANVPLTFIGGVLAAQDSGTTPLVTFQARRGEGGNGATVTTRPLFSFRNFATPVMDVSASGNAGFGGNTSPTAKIHPAPGTAAANTAPGKKNTGPLLTTTEAGAEEFLTDERYFTITTGAGTAAARKTYAWIPAQTDVTATRALDTTYTAPATRSIMVMATVRCAVTLAGGNAYVQGKSDTATPPTVAASGLIGIQAGLLGEDNSFQIQFVVAPGKTYIIASAATNGTAVLGSWFEVAF